jgi:hypothetical protein
MVGHRTRLPTNFDHWGGFFKFLNCPNIMIRVITRGRLKWVGIVVDISNLTIGYPIVLSMVVKSI